MKSIEDSEGRPRSNRTGIKILILCAVIVCLSAAGALAIDGALFSGRAPLVSITIRNGTGVMHYTAFHATTPHQMTEGLMNYAFNNCTANRTACTNEVVGELFSFGNSSRWCFWMENTPEPLVQAWLSKNGTVSYIYDGVPYSTDTICANGSAVLELGKDLGIPLQVGDVVKSG